MLRSHSLVADESVYASYDILLFMPNRKPQSLNPEHTISQAGLSAGDVLVIDYNPKEPT